MATRKKIRKTHWADGITTRKGETIGQRLTRFRNARGITQVELSKETGIAQNILSDLERERTRLTAEMIAILAKVRST